MMRLAVAIFLSSLLVPGAAVINCEDLSTHTCSDFCLVEGHVLRLEWYGMDCTQSLCDIAALASEALSTNDVADRARLLANRLGGLPDFSLCDGFVCGAVYDCDHSEMDVYDLCYNFEAYHKGQVCVSPDGLLIFSTHVDQDYFQASTSCGISSFEEQDVWFSRNVTFMERAVGFAYCDDEDNEAALSADVTSLAAQRGSGQLQTGQISTAVAPAQGATMGLVTSAVLSLMTLWWWV